MGLVRSFPVALVLAGCATAGGEPDAGTSGNADASETIDARRFPDASQPADALVPIDAMQVPDAMPGTPDAAPCTIQNVNLLANGAFDAGEAGWATFGTPTLYPIILSTTSSPDPFPKTPHSGAWGAWLGGAYGDILEDQIMYVVQQVAVPAGATNLNITGQRWFESADSGTFDLAAVEIWNTSDTYLQTVVGWDADDVTAAWTAFSGAVNNYAGQTIRVVLISANDFSLNTNWFFDSVAFNATVCQ
jgi:hypothetical protein